MSFRLVIQGSAHSWAFEVLRCFGWHGAGYARLAWLVQSPLLCFLLSSCSTEAKGAGSTGHPAVTAFLIAEPELLALLFGEVFLLLLLVIICDLFYTQDIKYLLYKCHSAHNMIGLCNMLFPLCMFESMGKTRN